MAKYYVTYDGSDSRIYESDRLNDCIRKAKTVVEDERRNTCVRTEGQHSFRSYSVKPVAAVRLKHPRLIKDEHGCICADLPGSKNRMRDTSARYNFDRDILVIAGRVVEKHPKFRNIDKFERWVACYFADGRDGFDG